MELLILGVIALLSSSGVFVFIIWKLLQLLRESMGINVPETETIQFNPNAEPLPRKNQPVEDYTSPEEDTDTVPLDQFNPRSDKPLRVKFTEDEDGNSLTEIKDGD